MIQSNSEIKKYTFAQLIDGLALVRPDQTANSQGGRLRNSTLPTEMYVACENGERTRHLTVLAGKLIFQKRGLDEVIALASDWNSRNKPPLEREKIESTCKSIFRSDLIKREMPDYIDSQAVTPLFDLEGARVSKFLSELPPPRRWLLKGIIPFGKVGAIVAPGGTGKSQFLLQMAVSVAAGLKFLDKFEATEPGGVLILAAEDDTEELHRRLNNTFLELGTLNPSDTEMKKRIETNLFVRSMVSENNMLTRANRRRIGTGPQRVMRRYCR